MPNYISKVKEWYDSHPKNPRPFELILTTTPVDHLYCVIGRDEYSIAVQGIGTTLSAAKANAFQNYYALLEPKSGTALIEPIFSPYSIISKNRLVTPNMLPAPVYPSVDAILSDLSDDEFFDFQEEQFEQELAEVKVEHPLSDLFVPEPYQYRQSLWELIRNKHYEEAPVTTPNYEYGPSTYETALTFPAQNTFSESDWAEIANSVWAFQKLNNVVGTPDFSLVVDANKVVSVATKIIAPTCPIFYNFLSEKYQIANSLFTAPVRLGLRIGIDATSAVSKLNAAKFPPLQQFSSTVVVGSTTITTLLRFVVSNDVAYVVSTRDNHEFPSITALKQEDPFVTPNMEALGDPEAGSKSMQPVIPSVPSGGGNTTGQPPAHADVPASSTIAAPVTALNTPQVRATRDMPSQMPLISMVGGPPNMASMNMYQDDFLNLVYREFDLTTITVQGGQAKGTIVAKFPYGLNQLNPYAQTWARLHNRFNGRIRLTFSVSAVPMLKGNVIIGVVRNMPASSTTTIDIASLQKINWVIMNLNGSGDYHFDLGDARQQDFFRNTSDDPKGVDPADLNARPGIIMAIYTPITNQFGGDADNSVVFNIRSQAISPIEDPIFGFYAYEPTDIVETVANPKVGTIPSAFFLADILPKTEYRSMFLDGTKITNCSPKDTYGDYYTFPVVHVPEGETNPYRLGCAPIIGTDTRALCYSTNMSPQYLRWNTVISDNSVDELFEYAKAGLILDTTGQQNDFLGYTTFLTPILALNFEAVPITGNDAKNCSWTILTLIYQRGFIHLISLTYEKPEGGLGFIRKKFLIGDVPLEHLAYPVSAGFPTSNNTLPQDYYNLVVATDGQVVISNPINQLPLLNPDSNFSSLFFRLRDRIIGPPDGGLTGSLFCMDLTDYRDGTQIGTICTLGNQLVMRTQTPNPGRSHFRINIDLEYLQLSNPRITSIVPNSAASPFLSLIEPASFNPIARMRQRLDALPKNELSEYFAQLLAEEDSTTPNAMMAGMMGAGAMSGLGQGLGNYFMMGNQNKQNDLDRANQLANTNLLNAGALAVARQNGVNAIRVQQSRMNFALQMRGFDTASGTPGFFTQQMTGSVQPDMDL